MSLENKVAYTILGFGIALAFVFYAAPIQILSAYGHSMEPTIKTGDAVVIFPTDVHDIEIGDIITFKHDDVLITHRVYGFEDGKIQTKGDSLGGKDPYLVKPSEVAGRLIFVVPYAGNILRYANTPAGFVVLILVPAALIILDESRKIKSRRTTKRDGTAAQRPKTRIFFPKTV